jgi:hypothetical protein
VARSNTLRDAHGPGHPQNAPFPYWVFYLEVRGARRSNRKAAGVYTASATGELERPTGDVTKQKAEAPYPKSSARYGPGHRARASSEQRRRSDDACSNLTPSAPSEVSSTSKHARRRYRARQMPRGRLASPCSCAHQLPEHSLPYSAQPPFGGPAVSYERPVALRPRLATGLPLSRKGSPW